MDYYYIDVGYFQKPEIRWLLKQEHGSLFVMMYMELCMRAWNNDTDTVTSALFQLSDAIITLSPEEMLMSITECDRNTAEACLAYLMKLKLITVVADNGNYGIYIPEIHDQLVEARENEAGNLPSDVNEAQAGLS